MWLKNGVLTKGPSPKSGSGQGPRIVSHRSQKTIVPPAARRLDSFANGDFRVCIKRSLGGLGDIIMATPIAKGAKRKWPNCHVTYAVPIDYANGDLVALLEHNPYIDEVIDYRLITRDHYDSFTDITTVGLSDEKPYTFPPNRIDLFARAAGFPLFQDFLPTYVVTEEEDKWGKEFVDKALNQRKVEGKIAVHVRSNDPKRTWPPNRLREFLHLAKQNNFACFLFGWGDSPNEWRLAGTTQVFDYKIRQAAAIIKHCDVVVVPDSSILHLAGALNKKIVSLFGSMPPSCRINHYPNAVAVVNQNLACLGCIYAACPNNTYCMSSITAEAVLSACRLKIQSPLVDPASISHDEMIRSGTPKVKKLSTFAI